VTCKWDVLKAVWASKMPAPAKAFMARLVDLADTETAIVDQRWTRSKNELAADLSMSPSTVADYADRLERGGWLKRDRPTTEASYMRGEKTSYRLQIGDAELPASRAKKGGGRKAEAALNPGPGAGLVRLPDGGSPGAGQGVVREPDTPHPGAGHPPVRETDEPRPAAGHKNPPSHQYPSDPPSTAAAAEETPAKPKRTKQPEPHREDVERLCAALADHRVRLGCKRPAVTDAWRKDARLLLDADEVALDVALKVLDWSQTDDFWKANIRGIPKFRKQFDTLRLRMETDRGRRRTAYQDPPNRDVTGYRKDF
jgi:hypothetical protein